MNYLKTIFSYLFSNLIRQVVAIATDGFSSFYIFLILFSRIACIVRWFIRTLATFIDLSFIFELDILNKRKPVEKSFQNQMLTFINTAYYLFFLRFTILLYLNSTDKLVWSHLYDLVVRNREQVSLQWWQRSVRQWWTVPSNGTQRGRRKITSWFNQLKSFIFFSRLKIHRSAKLLFYPHLEDKLRIKCVLVCYFFEALMVLIYAYYLVLLLYFDLGYSLRKLRKLPTTMVQWASVPFVYLINLQTAFYTYSDVLLLELLLYLVCHIYTGQYRIVNSDLEKVKTAMSKTGDAFAHPSSLLHSLNRFTSAYRTTHSRLTVFILRLNRGLISKVIAYYLHYYLPYHSNRLVGIHFDKLTLASVTFNSYWFLVFMWLFLLFITLLVARVNGEISRSGRLLSAIFARRGLLVEANLEQRRRDFNSFNEAETINLIGHREALKLSSYFELVWREEKQLAFTTGQSDTAMNWRFIYEIAIIYSSFVLYFASKFLEQNSKGA